ncbi:MAG: ORF6N domain-containing protein [Elusimicrobiota bacterium]
MDPKKVTLVFAERIKHKILIIRGSKVILDKDLAFLYGVPTKRLNEQVRRNIKRFPEDFMFQLTSEEIENWKSHIATSNSIKMGLRKRPYAFTQEGVAMLSGVLHSERAIQVNIQIMRVFVNIRNVISANRGIIGKLNQLENKFKSHDNKIKTIFEIIHRPSETKLLSPEKPFSNKMVIRDIISSCSEHIHWVDKYFSKVGLDLLAKSFNPGKVKNVKILMSSEKIDDTFISLYRDLRKEFKSEGVKIELRTITDHKLNACIHDRWIIAKNVCYNTPSTDTVARGQYCEVKKPPIFRHLLNGGKKAKLLFDTF